MTLQVHVLTLGVGFADVWVFDACFCLKSGNTRNDRKAVAVVVPLQRNEDVWGPFSSIICLMGLRTMISRCKVQASQCVGARSSDLTCSERGCLQRNVFFQELPRVEVTDAAAQSQAFVSLDLFAAIRPRVPEPTSC